MLPGKSLKKFKMGRFFDLKNQQKHTVVTRTVHKKLRCCNEIRSRGRNAQKSLATGELTALSIPLADV